MKASAELRGLVEAICNGTVTSEQVERLNTLLAADEEAALFYATYVRMHGTLLWRYRDEIVVPLSETLPPRPPAEVADPYRAYLPFPACHGMEQPASDWSYLARASYVLLAVVALVAFVGVLAWNRAEVAQQTAGPIRIVTIPKPPGVARIGDLADCRWAPDSSVVADQSRVDIGQKFKLESGLLEIAYDTGAKVILQGPVTYEISSANGGFLAFGRLTGHVTTDKARGFVVRTPTARVIDTGTEFGVEVNPQGITTSHVFRGSVRVELPPSRGHQESVVQVVREREAVRVERDESGPVLQPLIEQLADLIPAAFVRQMPKRTPIPVFGTGIGVKTGDNDPHWQIVAMSNDPGFQPRPATVVVSRLPARAVTPTWLLNDPKALSPKHDADGVHA